MTELCAAMAMALRPSPARPFAAPSFFPGDLLPIRVDVDQDDRRYKDAFLWHSAGKGRLGSSIFALYPQHEVPSRKFLGYQSLAEVIGCLSSLMYSTAVSCYPFAACIDQG